MSFCRGAIVALLNSIRLSIKTFKVNDRLSSPRAVSYRPRMALVFLFAFVASLPGSSLMGQEAAAEISVSVSGSMVDSPSIWD